MEVFEKKRDELFYSMGTVPVKHASSVLLNFFMLGWNPWNQTKKVFDAFIFYDMIPHRISG